MFSGFFPPPGADKLSILHRPPPFHKDYEDWRAWFLKLCIPTQIAPEVVRCAEQLPDTVGEVAFKQSLHVYSGGLVQSLNDSKNFPTVIVNTHGEKMRAFKVKSSKLESRAMSGAFNVPGLRLLAQTSISCEDHDGDQSVCQLAVQSASDHDMIGVRYPHRLEFWKLSTVKGTPTFEKASEVKMPADQEDKSIYTDVCLHPNRPGKGFAATKTGQIFAIDLERGDFEMVAVNKGIRAFERWHAVRTVSNANLVHSADRTGFRVFDIRIHAKGKPLYQYLVSQEGERIGEEVFCMETVSQGKDEEIFLITDKEVRSFDRRHIASGPIWRRQHMMNRTSPVYSAFIPGHGEVSSQYGRYFPQGTLCLAGHLRNSVSQLDVGGELYSWEVQEVPRVPLVEIDAPPFLNYKNIVTIDEGLDRLEMCGHAPVTWNARSHYELPIVGLTHHVLPVSGGELSTLFTCNAAGDLFCSVELDADTEQGCSAWDYRILEASFEALEPESKPLCSEHRMDWPVSDTKYYDMVNIDVPKPKYNKPSRSTNANEREKEAVEEFTADLLKRKRQVAFAAEGGKARVKNHFCNFDTCNGKPDGGSEEFRFTEDFFTKREVDDRPLRTEEAVEKALQAARYLFFPGMKEALYLYDSDAKPRGWDQNEEFELCHRTAMYPEAAKVIRKMKKHMILMPSDAPRLPGKNYKLQLVDDLNDDERRFLEEDDHVTQPSSDPSTLPDPLLKDFMAAMKLDAHLRNKEELDNEDEYDEEVAEFLNATRAVGGEEGEANDDERMEEDSGEDLGQFPRRAWVNPKQNHVVPRIHHASHETMTRRWMRSKDGRLATPAVLALECLLLKELEGPRADLKDERETLNNSTEMIANKSLRRAVLLQHLRMSNTSSSDGTNGVADNDDVQENYDPLMPSRKTYMKDRRLVNKAMALEELSACGVALHTTGNKIKSNPEIEEDREAIEKRIEAALAARTQGGKKLLKKSQNGESETHSLSTLTTMRTEAVPGGTGFIRHPVKKLT